MFPWFSPMALGFAEASCRTFQASSSSYSSFVHVWTLNCEMASTRGASTWSGDIIPLACMFLRLLNYALAASPIFRLRPSIQYEGHSRHRMPNGGSKSGPPKSEVPVESAEAPRRSSAFSGKALVLWCHVPSAGRAEPLGWSGRPGCGVPGWRDLGLSG